ncbi:hypothetical protein [Spirosoma koreense]
MVERLFWIGIGLDAVAALLLLGLVIKDWPGSWFLGLGVLFMGLPALAGYWLWRSHHSHWAMLVVGFPLLWSLPVAVRIVLNQLK